MAWTLPLVGLMDVLETHKWRLIGAGSFLACSMAGVWTEMPSHQMAMEALATKLPPLEWTSQKNQLEELLDRPLLDERTAQTTGKRFIFETVSASLPTAYAEQSFEITKTLIEESNRYDLDPVFLLAVIKTESHFNPRARGRHGEIGLMQILPLTAEWIARRLNMRDVDLRNPVINIRVGAAHLAQLRQHFDHVGNRYISAYNMGTRAVHRLLRYDIEPGEYSGRVISNYRGFYGRWMSINVAENKRVVSLNL